jgi:hypothetical protein
LGKPAGSVTVTDNLPVPGTDPDAPIINQAALEASSTGLADGSWLNNNNTPNPTRVTITWNCDGGGKVLTNTTATSTDPSLTTSASIRVQIDYTFTLITPFMGSLLGGQTTHIRSDLRGRAQY